MTTVVMSTPLLIKVQAIFRSNSLFSVYVDALKLDNQSASHAEVMRCVQDFLAQLPAPTRLRVQRAFAEAEASDSMGTKCVFFLSIQLVFLILTLSWASLNSPTTLILGAAPSCLRSLQYNSGHSF